MLPTSFGLERYLLIAGSERRNSEMKEIFDRLRLKFLAFVFVIGGLTGCGTWEPVRMYSGPALRDHKIAVVQACPPVQVEMVDGVSTGLYPWRGTEPRETRWFFSNMLPGNHTITVRLWARSFDKDEISNRLLEHYGRDIPWDQRLLGVHSTENTTLSFYFVAGHNYWILPGVDSSLTRWNPRIVDAGPMWYSCFNPPPDNLPEQLSKSEMEKAKYATFAGKIISVDVGAKTLIAQDKLGTITFDTVRAIFMQKGMKSTLEEFTVGDRIVIVFEEENGKNMAIAVDKLPGK
jgi:hypothetical protein